jgi:xanthine dehydrogenase YagR molybdenum-binding subunit
MSSNGMVAIGDPLLRVDGRAKVTGAAKFAAEFPVPGLVHGWLVMSTIASGKVIRMDTIKAERAPGVVAVITPANAIRLAHPDWNCGGGDFRAGEVRGFAGGTAIRGRSGQA